VAAEGVDRARRRPGQGFGRLSAVGSGLVFALVGAVAVAGLAIAAGGAPAQPTDQAPVGSPTIEATPSQSAPINTPQNSAGAPAPPSTVNAPQDVDAGNATAATTGGTAASAPATATKPPPPPPVPLRTPTAIMQVLDKVTAETLQFEAPIGRPIRYKTLFMTVRVCETRGAADPQPRPSAYLVMETRAPTIPGHEPAAAKRVFDGWMFANAPALHPLQHPIYDVWLVGCSAGNPVAR
jgi:hypothetical protein